MRHHRSPLTDLLSLVLSMALRLIVPPVIALAITGGAGVHAQSVTARLVLSPVLSSYVSDWERNPSQITLMVSNVGQAHLDATVTVELQGSRSGMRVTSGSRTVQLRPGSNLLLMKDLVDFGDLRFSGGGSASARRRLPDDEWQLCVSLQIVELNQEVPVCETFVLQFAVAPSLLHPEDEATVNTRFPVFQWNAASMKTGVRILYRLRIVEVQAGQSAQQALDSNPAVLRADAIPIPTYVYPVAGEPLKNGSRYAWQVQAVDEYGSPLGDNEGRSEIRQFVYTSGGVE